MKKKLVMLLAVAAVSFGGATTIATASPDGCQGCVIEHPVVACPGDATDHVCYGVGQNPGGGAQAGAWVTEAQCEAGGGTVTENRTCDGGTHGGANVLD